MDDSVANGAIKRFLEMDVTANSDIVHVCRMQADIGIRYLELQKLQNHGIGEKISLEGIK